MQSEQKSPQLPSSILSRLSPELRARTQTAVVGVAALLGLLILGGRVGTAFFALIMALGMVWEFVDMTLALPDRKEKRNLLLGMVWLIAFLNFWMPRAEYELLVASWIGLFGYFLFTAERHVGDAFTMHFKELIAAFFGLTYLGFMPLYLPLIRDANAGLHWLMIFLLINWSGDIGAYFVGKKYGKNKLYSVISPKKTWEGSGGGLACSVIITVLYKLVFFPQLSLISAILVPIVVGPVAQIGDLCESFLKRAFHRKDSGHLLPGHGGMLDRFDGVVFSLPVMYACVRLFG
jgi:phosphatidate cytidylyltransferase